MSLHTRTKLSKEVNLNDVFYECHTKFELLVLKNTQSGGVCVNDCLMHQAGKERKNKKI